MTFYGTLSILSEIAPIPYHNMIQGDANTPNTEEAASVADVKDWSMEKRIPLTWAHTLVSGNGLAMVS
jgi:hypothetical protein